MVTVTTNETINGTSSQVTIVSGETGTHITTSSAVTGGQLGGLLQAQTDLNGYIGRLNTFASTLISQVNTLHQANKGTAVFSGSDASSITASSTFLNNVDSNESSRALNIANLQGTSLNFPDGTTGTLQQYLSDFQQQIGSDTQQANTNASFNQSLQTELQQQQQSVSGVSIDEELVNVIQYQQIYEAAAKVVETTASMMDTVISMVQ
jgi:flagellar hook-associated protein 1 FlgK